MIIAVDVERRAMTRSEAQFTFIDDAWQPLELAPARSLESCCRHPMATFERLARAKSPFRSVCGTALAWLAATTLLGGCAPPSPVAGPVAPFFSTPAVPLPLVTAADDRRGLEIRSSCVLPGGRDLLYVIDAAMDGGTRLPAESLRIYRAGLDMRGWDGTSSTFADLSSRYPDGRTYIEGLTCHPNTGQVIASIASLFRAEPSLAADQWLFGPDGKPLSGQALAHDAGPSLAWSPDGRRLLIEDGEANGMVNSVDLEQGATTRIPDARLFTDIGAGAAGLYWTPDSRRALLVSSLTSAPSAGSDVLLWDVESPHVGPSGPYHLPGAEVLLVTPAGDLLYVVTDDVAESSPAPSRLFRWNLHRPTEDPVQIANFTLPPAHYHRLGNPAFLPNATGVDAVGARLVFTAPTAGGHAVCLLDVGDGGSAGLWRLTPATETVSDLQVAGDRLVYLYLPVRSGTAATGPVDGDQRVGVIPLAELEGARLAGDRRFARVEP